MTEPYEVRWLAGGRRALERTPEKTASAVVAFVYGTLADNPYRVGKPLTLTMVGLHAARRGDYRIIHRIDESERRVDIAAVEHRSNAYRPR